MQILFNNLWGRVVCAEDGIAGRVEDLFFDDRSGCVRHVVLSRGIWPKKQRVVLDPESLTDDSDGHVLVAMSCAEVGHAPHPDSCPLVSRQMQLNPDPGAVPSIVWKDVENFEAEVPGAGEAKNSVFKESSLTPFDALSRIHRDQQIKAHLRSVRAITGYAVETEGRRIARVLDVWLDTSTWQIAHLSLYLETEKQRLAVPLSLIGGISWGTDTIRLNASWNFQGAGASLEPHVSLHSENFGARSTSARSGSI